MNDYFKNKIYPTKGQVIATEKAPSFMEGPCYANSFLDYFRQAESGEFIIGGFRQEDQNPDIYSDVINEKVNKKLIGFIDEHIPKLKGVSIKNSWSGLMGFAADGQPIIGSIPGQDNIYFLGGYTGHGLGLAFLSAKVLSELILEGKAPPSFINAKRYT
jgi:hypothetical protein